MWQHALMTEKERILARLQGGEEVLTLLEQGELPKIRELVFDSVFDVRLITDPAAFDDDATVSDTSLERLVAASQPLGYIKTSFAAKPRFWAFCGNPESEGQAKLMANLLSAVAAIAYAAIGLDMTGLVKINPDLRRPEEP